MQSFSLVRYSVLFLILSFFGEKVMAQSFDFSENCTKAYEHIIALKIDSGSYYLVQEEIDNPTNYIPVLLENYIDFLEIYTSNSLATYEDKKANFEARLKKVKGGDEDSPYYLFSQAEIHLHSAVLHIKFGEYVKAVFDVRKALKKLKENQNKFPDFLASKKSLGTLYAILGAVPEQYQTGMAVFGLDGDVNEGMQMLQSLLDEDFVFQHEVATIYAFLQLHIENDEQAAWQTVQSYDFVATESVMDAYSIGHIGIHGNHTDEGLTALTSRPTSSDYLSFPYLHFLVGLGKTYRQDADANRYFQSFLNQNVGEDYIKSAYHKMAWNELIKGNDAKYSEFLAKISTVGRDALDTDKQAQREYENGNTPNAILLEARILTDGNYLTEAKKLLKSVTINDFSKKHEKTEYYYRLGRVYDKSGTIEMSKKYYQLTISNGQNVAYYFAANSAYLLGYIYEQESDNVQAKKYYDLSLSLDGYEYENSIHLKAKSGLNRLGY